MARTKKGIILKKKKSDFEVLTETAEPTHPQEHEPLQRLHTYYKNAHQCQNI